MTRWDYFANSVFVAAMFFTTLAGIAGLVVMADVLSDGSLDNHIEVCE